MSTLNLLKYLKFSFCFFLLLHSNSRNVIAKSNDFSLSVCNVLTRVGADKKCKRGILGLSFENPNKKQLVIHLSMIGFKKSQNGISISGNEDLEGDCSNLKYIWKNNENKIVTQGQVDLFGEINLKESDSHQSLFIPIDIPTTPGKYNLELTFNNVMLEKIANSYSGVFSNKERFGKLSVTKKFSFSR